MGAHRKTKRAGINVNLGASFPAPIVDEIELLARRHGIPKARVLRELALRGLAAYQRDGRVSESKDSTDSASGMTPGAVLNVDCEAKMVMKQR